MSSNSFTKESLNKSKESLKIKSKASETKTSPDIHESASPKSRRMTISKNELNNLLENLKAGNVDLISNGSSDDNLDHIDHYNEIQDAMQQVEIHRNLEDSKAEPTRRKSKFEPQKRKSILDQA